MNTHLLLLLSMGASRGPTLARCAGAQELVSLVIVIESVGTSWLSLTQIFHWPFLGKATRQKSLLQEPLALEKCFSSRRLGTPSLFSAQEDQKESHPEEQDQRPGRPRLQG